MSDPTNSIVRSVDITEYTSDVDIVNAINEVVLELEGSGMILQEQQIAPSTIGRESRRIAYLRFLKTTYVGTAAHESTYDHDQFVSVGDPITVLTAGDGVDAGRYEIEVDESGAISLVQSETPAWESIVMEYFVDYSADAINVDQGLILLDDYEEI